MNLFGKARLAEIKAAGLFVAAITEGVQEHWPNIAKRLRAVCPEDGSISDEPQTGFEFLLAVITCQLQALPNLLPEEQATRIRHHILQCMSSTRLGNYPVDTIQEYQNAWDQCLSEAEPPFNGLAAILFDKLECRSTVTVGATAFKNPILLLALSEEIVTFGGPWWNDLTERYKLVP